MSDTRLPVFNADGATAYIDLRTESTNGDGRQVIVFGDPAVNDAVAGVVSADPGPTSAAYGVVMRLAGSATITGSLTGITNSIAAHILSTGGTLQVKTDPSSAIQISNAPTITGITNSISAHILSTGGTINVQIKPGALLTTPGHTASIFTVTGSTSGGTTSGVTLIAPSASYNFKIFAYSLQTTGLVSSAWRFTNGAGSETELWRPLITAAGSSLPIGANMAVTPPGFIFATGVSTTLALKSDSGSLVHYSVSYIKESA